MTTIGPAEKPAVIMTASHFGTGICRRYATLTERDGR